MRCPKNPKLDMHEEDPRWTDHLASCASCRFEADRSAQLQTVLQSLPQPEAPVAVAMRLHQLAAATDRQSLECAEALELLEPYREGFLDDAQTFLVEDHLLWCTSCAAALETADSLTLALRALPQMTPPDAIAERLATARVPWWQRLWTAPAPSWNLGRLLQVGGVMAVVALCFAMLTKTQPKKDYAKLTPTNKVSATQDKQKPPKVVVPLPAVIDTKETMGFTGTVRDSGILGKPAVSSPSIINKTSENTAPFDEDRPPSAMDKAVALLNCMQVAPVVKITPRESAPADSPIVAHVGASWGADDDDYSRNRTDKPDDTPAVAYSARETFTSMNRDEELARSEEAYLLPDTMKFADATAQPEPSHIVAATQPVYSNDEVSKTLIMDIKRHTTPLAPIEAKSDHAPTIHTGVWIPIK